MDRTDRAIIQSLLLVTDPGPMDLVQAARLITRYRDSLLSSDLHELLLTAIRRWGFTVEQLQGKTRDLWMSGWTPTIQDSSGEVGSGADTEG